MPNRFAVRRAAVAALGMFLCGAATLASAAGSNAMAQDFSFTHSDASTLTVRKSGKEQMEYLAEPAQRPVEKSAAKSDGRVKFHDFTITHRYDKASPLLD